jgi:CheY-like chemotaxis protein
MLKHVFEPFFTTKDAHKGGGLGLSSVYGIVRQSGGAVTCVSEQGRGAEFTVLLPATPAPTVSPGPADARSTHATEGSAEVVLLVDDEAGVRGLARTILEASGYVVIDASDGREALDVLQTSTTAIDLLISDVLLPGIDGREVVEQALALRPALKVLFVSGYAHESVLEVGAQRRVPFLQKPFAPSTLTRTVREVLDSTWEGGAAV